ncbi:MAG: hypothetical protein Q9215_008114 [Flavoplaca cf. flavocitrina]
MTFAPARPPPERKQGFAYGVDLLYQATAGFAYCLDLFTLEGLHRESLARSEELLFPQNIKAKRAREAARSAAAEKSLSLEWVEYSIRNSLINKMKLFDPLIGITTMLSIALTEAARRITPPGAGGSTLPEQGPALPNTSPDSFEKAQELGARFPPGFVPGGLYNYDVPYTPITLQCSQFVYQAKTNSSLFDNIFRHIFDQYSNPRYRDRPLFSGPPYYKEWREEWREVSTGRKVNTASLCIFPETPKTDGAPWEISRGDFVDVAMGFNQLRLNYPKLAIDCGVWKEGRFPRKSFARWHKWVQ